MATRRRVLKKSRLREIRLDEGLSISQLARWAGVSTATIRDMEQEKRQVQEVTKHRIVNGLNENPRKKRVYKITDIFP